MSTHQPRLPRVLFINQHYWPDVAATGQNLTDLAEHLAARNWHVTVITSKSNYEHGRLNVPFREVKNGVQIIRVPAFSFGRSSNTGRIADYLSFIVLALLATLAFIARTSIVVTLTTPPFVATIGRMAQIVARKKHIVWSMDLHPEAEINLGMIKQDSLLAALLRKLNSSILNSADAIVSLGEGMKKRLINNYNLNPKAICNIRIWSDGTKIYPLPQDKSISLLPDAFKKRFIVHYSGNMGLVHHFDTMCQVMLALKDDTSLGFVFQGEGPRKHELVSFVQKNNLNNVTFLPYVPLHELNQSLAKAHLHWFSLQPDLSGVAVPAKLYGYMASQRPILFIGSRESDSGIDISRANAGYIINTGEAEKAVLYIKKLQQQPELRNQLGYNARKFFLTYSDKTVCCEQWQTLLTSIHHS